MCSTRATSSSSGSLQKGIRLERDAQPAITGLAFNMEDPVVGGYDKGRIALRRAIAMAYDAEEDARVIRHGQARRATQSIPPNVSGYDPEARKARSDATSRAPGRCSTSSATSIATATACARRPTGSR